MLSLRIEKYIPYRPDILQINFFLYHILWLVIESVSGLWSRVK